MKRRTFLLAALLTACTATPPAKPVGGSGQLGGGTTQIKPSYPKPKASVDDITRVVGASNRFAMTMFEELAGAEGNLAFSPASIGLALNMTRAGARGETAKQMRDTLAIDIDDDRAHDAFGNLLHGWNHGDGEEQRRPYELAVVNRLFGEQTLAFKKPFLAITGDKYGAELEPVSFKTAPESARETINAWVEDQTKERIRDLLPEGSIKTNTRLVLTNAIYFKGKWKVAFEEKQTRDATFHAPTGDVQVPMMNLTASFNYVEADGMKMVELPYEGDDLVMNILVPDEENGIGALQAALSHDKLEGWLSNAQPQDVILSLPRFVIDPPKAVKLKKTLIAMGMVDAFDGTKADLTGLADVPPNERLVIDDAYHKAFVEVNEEGTEAAAATAVVVKTEAAAIPDDKRVNADRPFLFLIRDKKNGAILFIGRVEKPTAA